MIESTCLKCGTKLTAPDEMLGKNAWCPKCKSNLVVYLSASQAELPPVSEEDASAGKTSTLSSKATSAEKLARGMRTFLMVVGILGFIVSAFVMGFCFQSRYPFPAVAIAAAGISGAIGLIATGAIIGCVAEITAATRRTAEATEYAAWKGERRT